MFNWSNYLGQVYKLPKIAGRRDLLPYAMSTRSQCIVP